ncbi:LLM class flavin-dependent oxidoreductase [Motilibacter aurantiacus]|uniref:LLM class flavin-dependent oxidoreductase n=1 Tax=Motilibacter aurantiacus TaxID=2714955 RepID=UPI0014079854|nr:LLM class flavin-dependent oxidoreductase [Motilibacter aurantiacus]NHC45542.1 LLM class flavin-dependent oxidoreductase [Motilibacter aurantiacus]
MELGITTFAETYPDPATGRTVSHQERLAEVLEEIELAEQVGLAVYGVGEHHRADFAASAPGMVLAAAAARTRSIRLSSAVTVLSSADPVRVFQEYATLDLLSNGRAELMAGRGSFIESFPLFGYSLSDYDELFAEKLELLLALRDNERVTWSGRFRPALEDQPVYPRPVQQPLPVWVAVGGTPESVIRAGLLGLPMALAIIGGQPARFAPLADLHRRAVEQGGHSPQPVAVHAHGYLAATTDQAERDYYPSYAGAMSRLGRERGWGAMTPEQYRALAAPDGSLVIGSPARVAEKILAMREALGIERFMLHVSVGTLPHKDVLRAIELLGTEVAPLVAAG